MDTRIPLQVMMLAAATSKYLAERSRSPLRGFQFRVFAYAFGGKLLRSFATAWLMRFKFV